MHIPEVSTKAIFPPPHLTPVAIVYGHHGLDGVANVLDLAVHTCHHIDQPGGLTVVVHLDGILPAGLVLLTVLLSSFIQAQNTKRLVYIFYNTQVVFGLGPVLLILPML